jgi:hypothetical protein
LLAVVREDLRRESFNAIRDRKGSMWVSDKVDEESEEEEDSGDNSNDDEGKDVMKSRLHTVSSITAISQNTAAASKDLYQRKDAVKHSSGVLPLSQRLSAATTALSPRTTAIAEDVDKKLCLGQGAVRNNVFKTDSPVKTTIFKDNFVKNSVFKENAVKADAFKSSNSAVKDVEKRVLPQKCDRPNAVKINVIDDTDRHPQSSGKVNFAKDNDVALFKQGSDKDRSQPSSSRHDDSVVKASSRLSQRYNPVQVQRQLLTSDDDKEQARARGPSPTGKRTNTKADDADRQRFPSSLSNTSADKKPVVTGESWRRNIATNNHAEIRDKTSSLGDHHRSKLVADEKAKSNTNVADKVKSSAVGDKCAGDEKDRGGDKVRFLQAADDKKERRPGPMAELAAAAGDEEIESMLDVWKRKRTLKSER